ncbi:MAG: glutamine synthetase family protein, partial [uncultured Rubellimicrobium sp.]
DLARPHPRRRPRLSRRQSPRRGGMRHRRLPRHRARQGRPCRQMGTAAVLPPAQLHLLPDHHRRLGRGRDRRLHRTRHGPASRHGHRDRGPLGGGRHAPGHPRRLRPPGQPHRHVSPQRAPPRGGPLPRPRLDPHRRPGDGVLPRRQERGPRQGDHAHDGPHGPPRRRPPGLFHDCRGRIRPRHRRHLRIRRNPRDRDRRHYPGRRRRPAGDQPPPRRPDPPRRRRLLLQAPDPRGRPQARLLRHLHGQAHRGRARLRHARPPLGARRHGPQHLHRPERRGNARIPQLHRRPPAAHARLHRGHGALREQLPPLRARPRGPHQPRMGPRQPHHRPSRPRLHARGAPHREPPRRDGLQPLPLHRGLAGLRLPRHGPADPRPLHVRRRRLQVRGRDPLLALRRPRPLRGRHRTPLRAGRGLRPGLLHREAHGERGIPPGHQPLGAGASPAQRL